MSRNHLALIARRSSARCDIMMTFIGGWRRACARWCSAPVGVAGCRPKSVRKAPRALFNRVVGRAGCWLFRLGRPSPNLCPRDERRLDLALFVGSARASILTSNNFADRPNRSLGLAKVGFHGSCSVCTPRNLRRFERECREAAKNQVKEVVTEEISPGASHAGCRREAGAAGVPADSAVAAP